MGDFIFSCCGASNAMSEEKTTKKKETASWESEMNDSKGTWERSKSVYRDFPETVDQRDHLVLYAAAACPWASRINLMIGLLGMRDVIPVVLCDPVMGIIDKETEQTGWVFSDEYPDTLNHKRTLKEVYEINNPDHASKSTTPALFDKKQGKVIHNESILMAKKIYEQRHLGTHPEVELFPDDLVEEIDALYEELYEPLLNGVYRAGFAGTQEVLDEVTESMFAVLEQLDQRLGKQRYILGDRFSFGDVIVFPTLLRFDFVYHVHFKCSRHRVQDYANLRGYVQELWQLPHEVQTVNHLDSICQHYYRSHYLINPRGLIARPSRAWLDQPHGRTHLPAAAPFWFMQHPQ